MMFLSEDSHSGKACLSPYETRVNVSFCGVRGGIIIMMTLLFDDSVVIIIPKPKLQNK